MKQFRSGRLAEEREALRMSKLLYVGSLAVAH
jgi:hypothetical protein